MAERTPKVVGVDFTTIGKAKGPQKPCQDCYGLFSDSEHNRETCGDGVRVTCREVKRQLSLLSHQSENNNRVIDTMAKDNAAHRAATDKSIEDLKKTIYEFKQARLFINNVNTFRSELNSKHELMKKLVHQNEEICKKNVDTFRSNFEDQLVAERMAREDSTTSLVLEMSTWKASLRALLLNIKEHKLELLLQDVDDEDKISAQTEDEVHGVVANGDSEKLSKSDAEVVDAKDKTLMEDVQIEVHGIVANSNSEELCEKDIEFVDAKDKTSMEDVHDSVANSNNEELSEKDIKFVDDKDKTSMKDVQVEIHGAVANRDNEDLCEKDIEFVDDKDKTSMDDVQVEVHGVVASGNSEEHSENDFEVVDDKGKTSMEDVHDAVANSDSEEACDSDYEVVNEPEPQKIISEEDKDREAYRKTLEQLYMENLPRAIENNRLMKLVTSKEYLENYPLSQAKLNGDIETTPQWSEIVTQLESLQTTLGTLVNNLKSCMKPKFNDEMRIFNEKLQKTAMQYSNEFMAKFEKP